MAPLFFPFKIDDAIKNLLFVYQYSQAILHDMYFIWKEAQWL